MIVKSSEPFATDASVDAPSATTEATAEEEDAAQDTGKTAALAKGGGTNLARIAGRTRLAREAGGISLARIARKGTHASLCCHSSQGETTTTIKTRGLGAFGSPVPSPASWVVLRPQRLTASSRSLLAR